MILCFSNITPNIDTFNSNNDTELGPERSECTIKDIRKLNGCHPVSAPYLGTPFRNVHKLLPFTALFMQ